MLNPVDIGFPPLWKKSMIQRYIIYKRFLNRNLKNIKLFFILFYAVGIAGLLIPHTASLFMKLIPFALLLSFTALVVFNEHFSKKQVFLFSIIYLTGYFTEVAGVNTGMIFGSYHYGDSLGISLFNTPLIIGLNWLLLVYISYSVMEYMEVAAAVKVSGGATLMLAYDLVIEQVAPELDMWHWHENTVPLQNYLAWFTIAILFHSMCRIAGLKISNKLGPFMYVCLALFFVILFILLK